jgi:hypothetical protein
MSDTRPVDSGLPPDVAVALARQANAFQQQIATLTAERDRLSGQLDAAEQHVKIARDATVREHELREASEARTAALLSQIAAVVDACGSRCPDELVTLACALPKDHAGAHEAPIGSAGSWRAWGSVPRSDNLPCQRCGGPHPFDTSVPSAHWNVVVRARGLPEYLCFNCIVNVFAEVGESFTATLWGVEFHGLPVEVRIRDVIATDAAKIGEENTDLRFQLHEATQQTAALEAALRQLVTQAHSTREIVRDHIGGTWDPHISYGPRKLGHNPSWVNVAYLDRLLLPPEAPARRDDEAKP